MKVLDLAIKCDQCHKTTNHHTGYIPDYNGPITKSYWCQHCKEAQVIKLRFIEEKIEVLERLEPSNVYIPRRPDSGITVKPRARKPRQKP